MTGASLVAFLLAIYLPNAFFRIWAERYVDLGRRKDVSQFDEIVAPILPSVFLHLQAWLLIHAICFIQNSAASVFRWERWVFPGADWHLLLTLSESQSIARLGHVLDDTYALIWPASYSAILLFVTFINAVSFGRGALNGIYVSADEIIYPNARDVVRVSSFGGRAKAYIAAAAFWFWKLFYWESFVNIFPWTVLKPFVFVKTKDSALFHGRFDSYELNREGGIDRVVLRQASRFTRRSIRDAIKDGEQPIRPLKGVLVLQWSEVVDINTTVPGEIQRLYGRYENLRAKNMPPQL